MLLSAQKLLLPLLVAFVCLPGYSQKISKHGLSGGIDVGMGYKGGSSNPSITYYELKSLLKNESLFIGWTARISAYYGNNVNYYTAPSRLTRGASGLSSLSKPILNRNVDTLYFDHSSQTSLNLGIRAEYYLGPFTLGASIDLVGLTLIGRSRIGHIYSSTGLFTAENASGQPVQKPFQGNDAYQQASPQRLNLQSLGDLSRGMLTTELYSRFRIKESISVKVGYQWLTTEMVLTNIDAVANNDRFRNRTGFVHIGLTFPFNP